MHLTNLRFLAVLGIAIGLVLTVACRGGATAGKNVSVPVVTPTTAPQTCFNQGYPTTAPQFGNDSSIKYTTTADGLGVYDEVVGTGTIPSSSSTVTVAYTGWLTDGCVFNSTYLAGSGPIDLQISQLIPGMQEGLSTMHIGGTRRIKIPPSLGYGAAGVTGHIPGNATIIFQLHLIGFATTTQTASSATSTCQNSQYPATAPQLGDDSALAYQTTSTGLAIYDETVGTGTALNASSTVTVDYTGWLSDGCVFDSSYLPSRGPATFPLSGLIPGMQQGISTMNVGGERRIRIPPALGYGASGIQGVIPPNSTLIFDVTVHSASSTSP